MDFFGRNPRPGKSTSTRKADQRRKRSVRLDLESLETRWMPASVQFASTAYAVNENARSVTLVVQVSGSLGSSATVDYSITGGTATAGADYTSVSGTLTFFPGGFGGGPAPASFALPVTDDDVSDGGETVVFTLSNPVGVTLGTNTSTTVTITNSTPSLWVTSAQQRDSDPEQGLTLDFGQARLNPQTGSLDLLHPLDFDRSPGTDVGGDPALVYRSADANPRPVVEAQFVSESAAPLPSQIQARLTWNGGAPQSWVTFATTGHISGDTYRLGSQVASAVTGTGLYSWTVEVLASFNGSGDVRRTVSGNAFVVAEGTSNPFGTGWGLAGLDRLVSVVGGVYWVSGAGGARYFASAGGGTFTSPTNDFGTLVQNGGGDYTYTSKYQVEWNFDSSGKLTGIVDPHNVARNFAYSSGRLSTVTATDGGVTTFAYDGYNRLETITQPGNRVVTLTHDATSGDLTAITGPANALRTLTYDGAHRATNERWGPLNTTYAYDTNNSTLSSINRGEGTTLGVVPAVAQTLVTNPANFAVYAVLTDAISQKTTYTLDLHGRLMQVLTPDGIRGNPPFVQPGGGWVYTRDGSGTVTSVKQVNDSTTTSSMTVGTAGNITAVDHGGVGTDQYQYCPFA